MTEVKSTEPQRPTFTNQRGQKLSRWTLDVDQSEARAVMIAVHGVGDHIQAYERLAQTIWEQSQILTCGFDLVGHGLSEGARVYIDDFQHYVDDLIMFADLVKAEYPDKKLFVMGHSMGGLVVCHTVLRKPDLFDGIILYAAAIASNPKVITPFKIRMAKIMSAIIPSFPVGSIPKTELTRNTEELEILRNDPLRHHGSMKARWGARTLVALEELQSRLSEISAPAFITHGEADSVAHYDGSKNLYEAIKDKHGSTAFKGYAECYHRIHSEPGEGVKFVPDICNWMLEFL